MSDQRHLRLAALIIGALAALSLLWLMLDMARRGPASGWWLEAALYGLMILTAAGVHRGSDLAWFGAVVLYACAVVAGVGTVLDLTLSIRSPEPASLIRTGLLLAAGVYGLWALLVSPRVKAFRAAHGRPDRFPLLTSLAVALAVAAGIGWYLDRLSPAIQRTIGVQAGIAAAFVALVAFLAARNRKTPIHWHYLPLAVAGVAVVANLEAISQLRELRPAAAALSAKPPKSDEELAAVLPGKALRMTDELEAAKREALARLEAHTAILGPWPLMEVLTPGRIADPAAVDSAAAALAVKTAEIRGAVTVYDTILGRFAGRRQAIVAPLAEPLRRRIEARFGHDEDAYRSHYGARVDLLSRAAGDLGAMLTILKDQRNRYTADWNGAVAFEDAAAGEEFKVRRASLKELVVWNARLRAEGADLAAGRPSWGWITSLD